MCLIAGAGFGAHTAPAGRSRQPWVPHPQVPGAGFAGPHPGECGGTGGCIHLIHLPVPGAGCLHPGPRSKPGNLLGLFQGFPMRGTDRPTPEGLDPRSRGHPSLSPFTSQGRGGSRPEHESSVHGTEVPKRRAPGTGGMRKGRKCTSLAEPARNTSLSVPGCTRPPKDADQPATGPRLPGPCHSPWIGRARRLERKLKRVPGNQSSAIPGGQVHHHLAQEEPLGPPGAELQEPRRQEKSRRPLCPRSRLCVQPMQELPETPVRELQPGSPVSAPGEPEEVPAVASSPGPVAPTGMARGLGEPEACLEPTSPCAESSSNIAGVVSAPVPDPELEPCEPSGLGAVASAGMAPGLEEREACLEPTNTCAESTSNIAGVVSAPVPDPELEPCEPSGLGTMAPAGMAPGLEEPEAGLETTSPCAESTSDISGVVSAPIPDPELEPYEPSGLGPVPPAGMAWSRGEPEACLEPTSRCAESASDIAGLVSAPVPDPELESREPSGLGPVASAGMARGLDEPEVGLESTSPCAASTWGVPRDEVPSILEFPPRLVAEQLTLLCAKFTRLK
nr:WAS/WASL-interacting protein family member 3-like [Manis javanica]